MLECNIGIKTCKKPVNALYMTWYLREVLHQSKLHIIVGIIKIL